MNGPKRGAKWRVEEALEVIQRKQVKPIVQIAGPSMTTGGAPQVRDYLEEQTRELRGIRKLLEELITEVRGVRTDAEI